MKIKKVFEQKNLFNAGWKRLGRANAIIMDILLGFKEESLTNGTLVRCAVAKNEIRCEIRSQSMKAVYNRNSDLDSDGLIDRTVLT